MFTGTQFVGNPLAVVLNAEGLSTGQMQTIAAEFNLAETTFVLPPKDAPQPLSVGAEVAGELVASACGISLADIETIHHRPRIASCGAPFILAELKSRTALIGASPNSDVFRLEVSKQPAVSIMLYTQVHEAGIDIRARMFAPHLNIPEDPATGAANVALIGLLAHLRPEATLSLSKTIAQGVEMGRPSILQAQADKNSGTVTATYIGGRCIPVMSGTIDLA